MPGSDESDSDEGDQGWTMATESELAPLEGTAISPVSFEYVLPERCSPPSQCECRRPGLEIGYSVGIIIQCDHVSWCHFDN